MSIRSTTPAECRRKRKKMTVRVDEKVKSFERNMKFRIKLPKANNRKCIKKVLLTEILNIIVVYEFTFFRKMRTLLPLIETKTY